MHNDIAVEGASTLPFYLIFDVSGSMSGDMPAVNQALIELKDEVQRNPLLADIARVSIISFGSDGRVELPMSNLAKEGSTPTLAIRGATS